jgi:hypothetical protein
MAGIEIVHAAGVVAGGDHPIDRHRFIGGATTRLVSPPGFALWLVAGELEDGVSLQLPEVHGDEAVYVGAGALRVDGVTCPRGGAAVIEAGAAPEIVAVGPTRVVHVGPRDPLPAAFGTGTAPPAGTEVHVVGPRGTYAAVEPGRDTHYYADSTCPTCSLTLLYTSRSVPYVSDTHSHSTDELIHVLWGELRLGSQVVRPGDTLAIDADRRYGFRSGPDGFGFLNYRREASQQTIERGSPPRMEGGLVNGLTPVMDLIR